MSIKTNELQQLEAALGTDSVVLDSESAGTARLRLDALARYMDGALLEDGTALRTALSNKADISTQQKVENTRVTRRDVNVAAEDLAAYIYALPRLLTDELFIHVTGTVQDAISIEYFYGGGMLALDGGTYTKGIIISYCYCYIGVRNATINLAGTSGVNGIYVVSCPKVGIYTATITNVAGNYIAAVFSYGSNIDIESASISNCPVAVKVTRGGVINVLRSPAENFSNNILGAMTFTGIVLLGKDVPDLLGGTGNGRHDGGLIVSGNGTLL